MTARGALDRDSRSLLYSIMLRAIALRPQRIVVTMCGPEPIDAMSRAMILSLTKRARLARVSLVVAEPPERVRR